MILFWSIAAAFTAAALLFLLPPLLRSRTTAPDAHVAANAAIYREQLAELAADLQRGAVTREEFERSGREIEHRIVSEHGLPAAPQPAGWRPNTAVAVLVGLLLPLAVVLGYRQLGEPRALDPESAQASAQQMDALVQRLSAHLQQTPQDADGWTLLARALSSLGRYDPASRAYARALQLLPDNRDLLVEFIKALALAGSAEFDGKNYAGAIGYWERILPFAPPQSEFARTVSASIAEARQLGGIATPAGASLQGIVSLAPSLKGKVSPGDTVFVLARSTGGKPGGSKMPLAVVRITADKLPYSFALDDSMAMAPDAKLSGQARVTVVARISKSGNALPQKGDIEGASAPVAPGASGVKVVISKIVN
ncbi:MAG TPA: c-type cytochrome biogenesis protein CcmI [Burkholderiales bacterium]|jgi:cytochrome c-type biogenesis protein CcmH